MKTKLTALALITAIVTLSFSFVSTNTNQEDKSQRAPLEGAKQVPVGGLYLNAEKKPLVKGGIG